MTRSIRSNSRPTPKLAWRFLGIILLQLAVVLAVPLPKAITRATGTTIALSTTPIDPYDILRGRYVTLGYRVERVSTLSELPGWKTWPRDRKRRSRPIYVILELDPDVQPTAPVQPWHAVAVAWERPDDLASNQRFIEGTYDSYYNNRDIDLGLGEYFIPEERGDALEEDMNEHPEATMAEIKLDRQGKSALVRLWVEDRSY